MSYKVCIDIGGTTFSFIIFINEDLFYHSKTYNIDSFTNHIEFINYLVNEMKNVINEDEIIKIGIACPGPLNSETGEILNTPHLKILEFVNLKNEFRKLVKCKNISIENDANVFALGAFYRLKIKNNNDVIIGITLGTGVGLGIVINNKLFKGSYGMAGEYELSPLTDNLNWSDLLSYKFFNKKSNLSPKDLFLKAENNDNDSINIWKEYGKNIGLYLTHVISILNPNHISIGGGVSKANKFFHSSLLQTLEKCVIFDKSKVNIVYDTDNLNIFYGNLL